MSKEWNWNWGDGHENGWSGDDYDTNKRRRKKARFTKLFWGLLLILIAVFLIISKLGLVTGISIWSVFFTVIFATLLIRGLIKRSFFSIFFSAAFLCIIYDNQLGITALTPWTVLFAALLLSIGMEILFHKKNSYQKLYQSNHFSTCSKYINPETFEKGMLENNFGSLNVFFENVATQKKEGFLEIDNSFGEMNIYVPSSWMVDMEVADNFGSNSGVKGHSDGTKSFLLHIRGNNSFGSVSVIYQ
ncbi:MAG: hypothetical protein NC409_02745 [Clostridium sp.]|nr:hypothetical protein [Clostridium sp.]